MMRCLHQSRQKQSLKDPEEVEAVAERNTARSEEMMEVSVAILMPGPSSRHFESCQKRISVASEEHEPLEYAIGVCRIPWEKSKEGEIDS